MMDFSISDITLLRDAILYGSFSWSAKIVILAYPIECPIREKGEILMKSLMCK